MLTELTSKLVRLASRGDRLLILTYHRVLPARDPLLPGEPTASDFSDQLDAVARACTVLPLAEAVRRLRDGTLPKGALSISFDDGYLNNYTLALPILRSHGMTATFFIATKFIDQGLMWNDRVIEAVRGCPTSSLDLRHWGLGEYAIETAEARRAALDVILGKLKYLPDAQRALTVDAICLHINVPLPKRLMMGASELRALRGAGMEIGAHTVNHPILASLSLKEAEREIGESQQHLKAITGEEVALFAYPNGKPGRDFGPEHTECLRRLGFLAAVTTAPGYADAETDVLLLPRTVIWSKTVSRTHYNLMRSYSTR
jgi:peptidoglycan/xylan/chitin deacetylase (PgdA/CDA1 family)